MQSSTENANLYAHFREVGVHSYRSVVQFWDMHREEIYRLPVKRYFEVLNEYGRALFELGKYKNYLAVAEEVLELSIEYNIPTWEDKDIIRHILIKKAAAHYHLFETEQAEHLLKELLKLESEHKTARLLLERCMMRKKKAPKPRLESRNSGHYAFCCCSGRHRTLPGTPFLGGNGHLF